MSTDDSFKKNRRFSRLAPTILLLRIDDSFRKHRRLFFIAPWILGPVNQLHFPKESFPAISRLFFSSSTESADSLTEVILHQQTPATRPSSFFVDKTFISNILNPGHLQDRAKISACSLGGRASMRRSLYLDWHPARKMKEWTSATYASEKRMLLVVTKLILLFPSEDTYKVSSICLCVKGWRQTYE